MLGLLTAMLCFGVLLLHSGCLLEALLDLWCLGIWGAGREGLLLRTQAT